MMNLQLKRPCSLKKSRAAKQLSFLLVMTVIKKLLRKRIQWELKGDSCQIDAEMDSYTVARNSADVLKEISPDIISSESSQLIMTIHRSVHLLP
jgi:hypothetical protein